MLRIEKHGPITVFRMRRHVAANCRWVLYETHAFLIDDTMIDTGTITVHTCAPASCPFLKKAAFFRKAALSDTANVQDTI